MKFGICLPIRLDAEAETNIEIAKAAEDLGFDSVWASDHVIMPEERLGMFTGRFYDPFMLLGYIAAVTSTITIGTSVVILPYRNPLVVAKMVATLDVLSRGRVIFGVGPGWMREEFEALGVSFQARGRMTDEYIDVIRALWEKDAPGFAGEFCSFSNIKFYPKPYQEPRPPIWIAGSSAYALGRAARLGDGWHPTWVSPDDVRRGIGEINRIANESGRDLDEFTYSVRNRVNILRGGDADRAVNGKGSKEPVFSLWGTTEEIAGYIEAYGASGVSHIVFDPDADGIDEIYYMMEVISKEIIPIFRD